MHERPAVVEGVLRPPPWGPPAVPRTPPSRLLPAPCLPGLSLDPDSGEISGTPTANGTFRFTVTATDPNPNVPAASRQFTLTVQSPAPLPAPPAPPTCGPKASTSSPATTAPTSEARCADGAQAVQRPRRDPGPLAFGEYGAVGSVGVGALGLLGVSRHGWRGRAGRGRSRGVAGTSPAWASPSPSGRER
ncbi:Ig domain-containing protein [Streptomyces mirabilis]